MASALGLWGPVLGWLAVSFAASARSEVGGLGRIPDWITHGVEYFVLGILLCRALAGGFGCKLSTPAAVLAIALGVGWGLSDEWHQSFVPRRDPSGADVVKDLGGCGLAVLAWRALSGSGAAPRGGIG